jgi:transposase
MMGRLNHDQEEFFYSFRLDDAVPDDHPVREVAAVLDLSWVHSELAAYYPRLGRPSIDPVLMIRMLIVGYVFGIRSERALCRDVRVNLAYRWFCGLSIEDKIPDHSAFSRARNERFRDSDIFRSVFERVVGACIGAGLVGGEGFAVDASLIVADANKQRSTPGARWHKELDAEAVSRATKEYLATLDDAAFGAASDVAPKFVSPSDPAAQWTGAQRGPAFFAYSDPTRAVCAPHAFRPRCSSAIAARAQQMALSLDHPRAPPFLRRQSGGNQWTNVLKPSWKAFSCLKAKYRICVARASSVSLQFVRSSFATTNPTSA